jgi:hypothetical protein
MKMRFLLAGIAAVAMMTGAAQAATTVGFTIEGAGQKTTTAVVPNAQVETFSEIATGTYSTPVAASFTGVTGTYAGLSGGAFQVNNDGYGNDGNYGVTFNTAYGAAFNSTSDLGYSLTLSGTENYFGAYIQSTDATNTIMFYNGSTLVGEFDATSMFSAGVANQESRFVNIYTHAAFDKVVFTEADTVPGETRGFETDNHTIGSVPEPASWALMIIGLGAIGGSLRSRRRTAVATA